MLAASTVSLAGCGANGSTGSAVATQAATASVPVSVKAEGWSKKDGEFGFAVVGEDGKVAEEGKVAPGRDVTVELGEGVWAVSITSIPTASDGKSTWVLPAAQQLMVSGGAAEPSSVAFTLTPVDPTDEDAVAAVVEALPASERESARAQLEAKRSDPKSDKVASAPAKPVSAPTGGSSSGNGSSASKGDAGPKKKWGVVKEAWEEKVLVKAAWTETKVLKEAWTERKLVRAAWTETVNHPAQYETKTVKVGVYYEAEDGTIFDDETECAKYCWSKGNIPHYTMPKYEEQQVLVKDAWTETVNHPAEYQDVQHPAETQAVDHPAEYRTVRHEAEYGWVDA